MGLLYMISDTELSNGEVLNSGSDSTASKKNTSLPKTEKQCGRSIVAVKTSKSRLQRLCLLVPHSIMLLAFAVLAYQGVFLFKYGWWKSVKASVLLHEVLPAGFVQWIRSGTSWSGVNQITSFIFNTPLVLFLLVCGLAVRVLIARGFGLLRRERVEQNFSWRG